MSPGLPLELTQGASVTGVTAAGAGGSSGGGAGREAELQLLRAENLRLAGQLSATTAALQV